METFKVIKEEKDGIISFLRCSDNKIFNVGDHIEVKDKSGHTNSTFIDLIQPIEGLRYFPRGTIFTELGCFSIENIDHFKN